MWSQPHRWHRGHQAINHFWSQVSGWIKGYASFPFKGSTCVFNIPASPSADLWAQGPPTGAHPGRDGGCSNVAQIFTVAMESLAIPPEAKYRQIVKWTRSFLWVLIQSLANDDQFKGQPPCPPPRGQTRVWLKVPVVSSFGYFPWQTTSFCGLCSCDALNIGNLISIQKSHHFWELTSSLWKLYARKWDTDQISIFFLLWQICSYSK